MRIAPADTFTLTEFRFRNNYPETEHKPSTCGIFITDTTYPVKSKTNSLEREVNWISPCLYIINDLHIRTEQVHDCTNLQVSHLAGNQNFVSAKHICVWLLLHVLPNALHYQLTHLYVSVYAQWVLSVRMLEAETKSSATEYKGTAFCIQAGHREITNVENYNHLKGISPKKKCWKCTRPKDIQDVDEFVSSSEHIGWNLPLNHLFTNGSSAVNGCHQNDKNSW